MQLHGKTALIVLWIAGLASVMARPASAGMITFDGYNMTANGTTTLDGTNLQLSQSVGSGNARIGTAFITQAYAITQSTSFTASFAFSIQNDGSQSTNEFFPFQGNGGGFAFIVQNTSGGPNAQFGNFGNDSFSASSNSLGVLFSANQPNNQAPSGTAGTVSIDPPNSSFGASPSQNFDLQGGQAFAQMPGAVNNLVTGNVMISYDATQSLLTVVATNSTGDSINFSDSLNLYNIVTEGAPPASAQAYFGLEGSEGGGFLGLSQTEISNFSLSVGLPQAVPEPATFGLLATGLVGVGLMLRRKRA